MTTPVDPADLATRAELHKMWVAGLPGGERADLTRADLTQANLADTTLSGADLSGADLSGADLSGAVSALAREKGWALRELHESPFSLEDTFIALTRQAGGSELMHLPGGGQEVGS